MDFEELLVLISITFVFVLLALCFMGFEPAVELLNYVLEG